MTLPHRLLGLVALGLAGCTSPATEVLVRIDTDIPADIPLTISTEVRQGTVVLSDSRFDHTWTRGAFDGGIASGTTFAITPGPGVADDATMTLLVEADGPGFTLRRLAQFAFTPHQTRSLEIYLSGRCLEPFSPCSSVPPVACTLAVRCQEQGQTCDGEGTCVPVTVTTTPGTPDADVPTTVFEFRDAVAGEASTPTEAGADAGRCGPGRACCSDTLACPSPSVCTVAGTCQTCGLEQQCCINGVICPAGLVCVDGQNCGPCGAPGQNCCFNSGCTSTPCYGHVCMTNSECGSMGQSCCNGYTCNQGLACSCNTAACGSLCIACRTVGQSCTRSNDCCGGNVCCPNGTAGSVCRTSC